MNCKTKIDRFERESTFKDVKEACIIIISLFICGISLFFLMLYNGLL